MSAVPPHLSTHQDSASFAWTQGSKAHTLCQRHEERGWSVTVQRQKGLAWFANPLCPAEAQKPKPAQAVLLLALTASTTSMTQIQSFAAT